MSIPTIYIRGTKKEINEKLALGVAVYGVSYTPYDESTLSVKECPEGTVIKFWLKRDYAGTPIAKSYGNWKPAKNKIV